MANTITAIYYQQPLSLVICGVLGIGILLLWRYRTAILIYFIRWFVEYVMNDYSKRPERYAEIQSELMKSLLPRAPQILPRLLPIIRPLLGSQGGQNDNKIQARRIGNYLQLEYTYCRRSYIVLLNYRDRSAYIVKCTARINGQMVDVTDKVRSYAGPSNDFHGQLLKPRDLVRGCTEMLIEYSDKVILSANGNDVLDLYGRGLGVRTCIVEPNHSVGISPKRN